MGILADKQALVSLAILMVAASMVGFVGWKILQSDSSLFLRHPLRWVRRSVRPGRPGNTDLKGESAFTPTRQLNTIDAGGRRREPYQIVIGYDGSEANLDAVQFGDWKRVRLVVAKQWTPILAIGATDSSKTTGLTVPAVAEWQGAVISTSVKDDVMRATIVARNRLGGKTWVFDPSKTLDPALTKYRAHWTPLAASQSWEGAYEMAKAIIWAYERGSAASSSGSPDGHFWTSQATIVLAALLFATAQRPGTTMRDVRRQLNALLKVEMVPSGADGRGKPTPKSGFEKLTERLLTEKAMKEEALRGAESRRAGASQVEGLTLAVRDYETAIETLDGLEVYGDKAGTTIGGVIASTLSALEVYLVAPDADVAWDDPELIDVEELFKGPNTLYLVAPPNSQRVYAPLFGALVQSAFSASYRQGQLSGGKLETPCLFALDEFCNVAPIAEIATYASTARSYRIQLLIVIHDLSQLKGKIGEYNAASVLSSSVTTVLLSNIKDLETLRWASGILGEYQATTHTHSVTTSLGHTKASGAVEGGGSSKSKGSSETDTEGKEWRPIASPARIAAMGEVEALAIIGQKRTQMQLRRSFEDPYLVDLLAGRSVAGDGPSLSVSTEKAVFDLSKGEISDPEKFFGPDAPVDAVRTPRPLMRRSDSGSEADTAPDPVEPEEAPPAPVVDLDAARVPSAPARSASPGPEDGQSPHAEAAPQRRRPTPRPRRMPTGVQAQKAPGENGATEARSDASGEPGQRPPERATMDIPPGTSLYEHFTKGFVKER